MALIDGKSLEQWRDIQLNKWKELLPNANISPDSMIFLDAAVFAEVMYLQQQDAITLVNNSFLAYATGDELSNLGLDRGIARNQAVKAIGTARFGRDTLGTSNYVIPQGTLISTQPSGTGSVIIFTTTGSAILYGQISTPNTPNAGILLSGGSVGTGTYHYKITAVSGDGKETDASGNVEVSISSGTTNVISLTWTSVANAVSYNVYISSDNVTYKKLANSTDASYLDTVGSTGSTDNPPASNETGNLNVDVAIEAQIAGTQGNVAPDTITQFIDKPFGIDTVTNTLETTTGSDAETDDIYRERIQAFLSSNTGKVTVAGYKQTAESYPGVKSATVESGTPSNNIVITITADNITGVPTAQLISDVQEFMERDENRAVCDNITVQGPSVNAVSYTLNIIEKEGSISEADLSTRLQDVIAEYLPTIPVGTTVYVVDLENLIHDTDGVIDFELTAPASNINLTSGTIAIAGTATITFS